MSFEQTLSGTVPSVATALRTVAAGATLSAPLAEAALAELMDGRASPTQVAALLAILRSRGETPEELAAFARVMRARAVPVGAPSEAIDLCGTGADGAGTFNISTVAAFVVAGAGVPVAKHGNRAITSRCGSADLIEALGLPLDPGPEAVAAMIRSTGFGFMFAPAYHPAMKYAMPIRRELPMRTAFNLLGPLSSPAAVRRQLVGVAEPGLVPLIAGALALLGVDRALVVHGSGGIDELSLAGPGQALLVEGGEVREVVIDGAEHGLERAPVGALTGGDAAQNVGLARAVLDGERGPARDVVLLNAGAAMFVSGRARDVDEGIALAARSIDSGKAAAVVSASAAARA